MITEIVTVAAEYEISYRTPAGRLRAIDAVKKFSIGNVMSGDADGGYVARTFGEAKVIIPTITDTMLTDAEREALELAATQCSAFGLTNTAATIRGLLGRVWDRTL
jgi:hypothetical protein